MNKATARPAINAPQGTSPQGMLLAFLSIVLVVGGGMLAPVLPSMVAHYDLTNSGAESKVLIAMGLPALMVGLFANLIGLICDRVGRKKILLLALFGYSSLGMFPVFIPDNLNLFVASRGFLGIFEAAIVVSSSALLGDYFSGEQRQIWFIRQMVAGGIAGVVLVLVSGALGQIAWNTPFYIYGLFYLAIPLAMILLYEPDKPQEEPTFEKFPWDKVLGVYLVAFFAGVVLVVVPVQLGFILTERGVTAPLTIGVTNMVTSSAALLGSLAFGLRKDSGFKINLAGGLVLIATGILLIGVFDLYAIAVVGSFLSGFGGGFALPAMVTEVMRHLPFEWRGRGNGRYNASLFLGAFLSPLIVLAAAEASGGLPHGFIVIGVFGLLLAFFVATLMKSRVNMPGID